MGASLAPAELPVVTTPVLRARVERRGGTRGLSPRKVSILQEIATGATNREVAQRLTMSENTVKWHLKAAYAQLGVANRCAAITVARDRGFIA